MANPVMAIAFLNTTSKIFGMNQTHQLGEDIFPFVHRGSLLSNEVVFILKGRT